MLSSFRILCTIIVSVNLREIGYFNGKLKMSEAFQITSVF